MMIRSFRSRVLEEFGNEWDIEIIDGIDHDLDSALWIYLRMKKSATKSVWNAENRNGIRTRIFEIAKEYGIIDDSMIYIRFRK